MAEKVAESIRKGFLLNILQRPKVKQKTTGRRKTLNNSFSF
jgi:hypothetical protein